MDEKPKRRRRWFRFTLRTWLIAVTALCLWLGWWAQSALRQKQAVALLRSKGVQVQYDVEIGEYYDYRVLSARSDPPPWFERLLGIDYFHDVVAVTRFTDVASSASKGEVLDNVRSFPHLRYLFLLVSDLTDDDLREIGKRHALEVLTFDGSRITPRGWRYLRALGKLQGLVVQGMTLSQEAAAEIAQPKTLTGLSIYPDEIESDALATIATMERLDWFSLLAEDPIPNEELAHIASMSHLQELNLWQCIELSDESFERLASMKKLEVLSLSDLKLNDRKIAALAKMQGLQRLELWTDEVDHGPIDLRPLQQALPNCQIETDLGP